MKKNPLKLEIKKIPISTLDDVQKVVGGTGCGTRAGDCNPNGGIYTLTCLTCNSTL